MTGRDLQRVAISAAVRVQRGASFVGDVMRSLFRFVHAARLFAALAPTEAEPIIRPSVTLSRRASGSPPSTFSEGIRESSDRSSTELSRCHTQAECRPNFLDP